MIYIPDTNVWIKLLNPGESSVKSRFRKLPVEEIRLCSMVKAELFYGAYKSSYPQENLDLLERLFAHYDSFPFDDKAAQIYGEIRTQLQKQGTPIGPNDLIIAAIALAQGAVLVSHNLREFQRVSELPLEDWESESSPPSQ